MNSFATAEILSVLFADRSSFRMFSISIIFFSSCIQLSIRRKFFKAMIMLGEGLNGMGGIERGNEKVSPVSKKIF